MIEDFPFFLAIPTFLSLVAIIICIFRFNRDFSSRKQERAWGCAILFFLIYGVIVGAAMFNDIHWQKEVNKYDLNHDGIYSADENTPEQEYAYSKLINDTGRTFSVFTGAILAAMISLPIYFLPIRRRTRRDEDDNINYT